VVSVNPVKMSLEDYFMAQMDKGPEKPPSEESVDVLREEGGK